MCPGGSFNRTLGLHLVALFENLVEPLGGGAMLEEACHSNLTPLPGLPLYFLCAGDYDLPASCSCSYDLPSMRKSLWNDKPKYTLSPSKLFFCPGILSQHQKRLMQTNGGHMPHVPQAGVLLRPPLSYCPFTHPWC